jgi:hypothetical protein
MSAWEAKILISKELVFFFKHFKNMLSRCFFSLLGVQNVSVFHIF